MSKLSDLIESAPTKEIQSAFVNAFYKIHGYEDFATYKKIMVSVSGGSDSDILMDFVERIGHPNSEVSYVFFDTGMEFKATKEHLKFLERKYGVTIHVQKAQVPVPLGCKKYGVPFLSKRVSDYINRLQKHEFQWEDMPFEILYKKYPKCKAALRWWCNEWGKGSRLNISQNKFLKEFLIENPPDFLISPNCCNFAKKKTADNFVKNLNPDLNIQGVRKAEGGTRSTAYKSCFTQSFSGHDYLRPIFWFKKIDKEEYEKEFGISHSKCYSEYGLKRTGCACCPFGRDHEKELEAAKKFEPNLYNLAINVFGKSYEYYAKYKEFCKKMDVINR